MDRIRIALANRAAGTAPVFAAFEAGYFIEEGLTPELIFHPGHAASMRALLAGEAEFTNAVAVELIRANLRHGGEAVIIASAIARSAQQVSARPGLETREDLRGKRWGILARHDADDCSIAMAFERWGWDRERDAEIVVVGSDGARLDLLLDERRVDVAIMHAPEPFLAARRGWRLVEDLGRLDVAFQNSCAATRRRLLEERPDTVRRYTRAYCRGIHRFRTDADFGVAVLRKYTGQSEPDVLGPTWVMYARYMGAMMFPSLEGVRNAGKTLYRLGAVPAPVAPESVVDLGPVTRLEEEGFFMKLMGLTERALA
jgi:ABC-type nitrate/sulfonate/bicarbonate transport system substrate-binding protein